MNASTANERANSSERERIRIEADLKAQKEACAKEIDLLRSQAQLADARLQAQQDFVIQSENANVQQVQQQAQIYAQTLSDNAIKAK